MPWNMPSCPTPAGECAPGWVPGIRRDPERERAAFGAGPLNSFFHLHAATMAWVAPRLWRAWIPVAPRLLRAPGDPKYTFAEYAGRHPGDRPRTRS